MITWLLLTYKLPAEPSARRVRVWRKLKKMGAVSIFEAVWALPSFPRSYEQFQWLVAEIQEMGGEAMFWKAQSELASQEDELVLQFTNQVNVAYQAIINRLAQPQPDMATLAQEYQQVNQRDYFHSELGQQLRERLLTARGDES
ncbi:ChrB protein [bacterium]|nr:ChrB protein [bacterium]